MSNGYEKGNQIFQNEKSAFFEVKGQPHLWWVEDREAITDFHDPVTNRSMKQKAIFSTTTTGNVSKFLIRHGIPVAFCSQESDTAFVARRCRMIPIRVVAGRYAVGSCQKRTPDMIDVEGEVLSRLDDTFVELFLKTTRGGLIFENKTVVTGLYSDKGEENPFMLQDQHSPDHYNLYHPRKVVDDEGFLDRVIKLHEIGIGLDAIVMIEKQTLKVFQLLEAAWDSLGCRLMDVKIEFGFDLKGNLVITGVIDNTSWQLRDSNWRNLSILTHRGASMDEIVSAAHAVAELSNGFANLNLG